MNVNPTLTISDHHYRFQFYYGEYQLVITRRGIAQLWGFEVYPDYRGAGMAHALLRDAIKQARLRSARGMWLAVKVANIRAVNLYQKYGFFATKHNPASLEFEMEKDL